MISCDSTAVVYVVDDEPLVRSAIATTLMRFGYETRPYESADALLEDTIDTDGRPCCLVLDIALPGMTGPELQDQLAAEGQAIPIIAMSGAGDVGAAVKMVRDGALDMLEKPFTTDALLRLVRMALSMDARRRRYVERRDAALQRLSLLSPRERDVLAEVCQGRTTKQIAADFNIGVQTIAKHKARILDKCQVRNELELIRFVLQDAELYQHSTASL